MAEPSSSPHQNTTAATRTTATTSLSWGTLEELLLACAVHRYGTNSWDSIARELQNRTTFSLFTPHICQQRYRDLQKRFASNHRNAGETCDDDATPWLDELRRLRVAELRRDLQRYDHSIVSLQLKVKKLKEERDQSVKEEIENESNILDEKILENDKMEKDEAPSPSEPDRVEPVKNEPGGDSCNGSSNSKEEREGEEGRGRERVDSDELVESMAESKDEGEEGVKESSDVQSTASLWRSENNSSKKIYDRRDKKVGVISGTSSGEENQSSPFKASDDGKLQPLVEFLDIVRARKLAFHFQRRLDSQDTPRYTNLIRQHIDLDTIQRKLEEGQYTDCHTKFYRDLMLLTNNAVIFFGERSSEHKAALELRQLINKQFQLHLSSPLEPKSHLSQPARPAPLPNPSKIESNQADPTDLKPKLTINGPVIACRKRSSITAKSSRVGDRKESMSMAPKIEKPLALELLKQQVEKVSSKPLNAITKKRSKEQSFGSRSSSSNNNNSNLSPKTPVISGKVEISEAKGDRKKPGQGNSMNKLKQWSGSGKNTLLESLKNSDKRKTTHDGSSASVKNGSSGSLKNDKRKEEASLSKLVKERAKERAERENLGNRSNRRPPKKAAATTAGKRGRNGGEAESHSRKRPRK